MKGIVERLEEVGKLETPPRMFGRRMTMILAPDKIKIEKFKRLQAKANPKADPPEDKKAKDKVVIPETKAPPVIEQAPTKETVQQEDA